MKKLLIITLILSAVFCFGCSSKNDDSNNMVKLNKVDISALSNQKIKNIIVINKFVVSFIYFLIKHKLYFFLIIIIVITFSYTYNY